jgi:hypothetical protein
VHPFLVNRKDKFARHVGDKHKGCEVGVVEESRVDFRARGVLGCGVCGKGGGEVWSWDERCRHVLGHFEEQGGVVGEEDVGSEERGGAESKSPGSDGRDKDDDGGSEAGGA